MSHLILKSTEKFIIRKQEFEIGDTVKIHYKIIEGDKERIQIFSGVVIRVSSGSGLDKTFTVRRYSYEVGVERIFPLQSPRISQIEIVKKAKIRRAKLYYLRDRKGKKAKLKERRIIKQKKVAPATPKKEAEKKKD